MSCLRNLKAEQKKAAAYAAEHAGLPGEMEWFLDNWYIAEREGKETAAQFRSAPRLRRGEEGACLLTLTRALVEVGEGEVTPPRISAFFEGVQQVRPLDEQEISLLLPAVSAALILRLGELAVKLGGTETPGFRSKWGAYSQRCGSSQA